MRRLGGVAALLSLLLMLFGAASVAGAQQEQPLTIRSVDGTDPDNVIVDFGYSGARKELGGLTVRENGGVVESSPVVRIQDSDQLVGTVLVIDTSESMNEEGRIGAAREAAKSYIEGMGANDRVAIVSFDEEAEVEQEFTDDVDQLVKAVDELEVGGATALFDGVATAVELYENSDLQPNLIVLSDGGDTSSKTNAGEARALVTDAGALVYTVTLSADELLLDGFDELAKATGGKAIAATETADLTGVYDDIQNALQNQYRVSFSSKTVDEGLTSLSLGVGVDQAAVDYSPGSRSSGSQLTVAGTDKPFGPGFLQNDLALYLIVLVVLVAVGGAVYAIVTSFVSERQTLDTMLQPYTDGFVATDDDDDIYGTQLAQTPLLQRAVAITGSFAEKRGVLVRVEHSLERANLPLRAAEAMFFFAATVVVLFLLVLALSQNFIIALIAGVFAALVGPAILNFLASRRQKEFLAQLPDMLQLLSGTLRAGYSLMQGVEAVSQEVAEPMGKEVRRVVTEARLGRPLEESLDAVAERMDSRDFAWAVMAIRIQREVGGNLSELLLTVAETMTARERLRRDVASLTAEGKISAIVLGLLPIGLGLAMYTINREYIETLFDRTAGQIAVAFSVGLAAVGFYWMKKIIEIDI